MSNSIVWWLISFDYLTDHQIRYQIIKSELFKRAETSYNRKIKNHGFRGCCDDVINARIKPELRASLHAFIHPTYFLIGNQNPDCKNLVIGLGIVSALANSVILKISRKMFVMVNAHAIICSGSKAVKISSNFFQAQWAQTR